MIKRGLFAGCLDLFAGYLLVMRLLVWHVFVLRDRFAFVGIVLVS